jgi:hypothetical protein
MSELRFFKYVRHAEIADYEADNWIVVDDFAGTSHGLYSVLMEYKGGDPEGFDERWRASRARLLPHATRSNDSVA